MSLYFTDDSWYLITVPTNNHQQYFSGDLKQLIKDKIISSCQRLGINDFDFSIMNDHYHFLSKFNTSSIIPKLMNLANGGSSYELGKKLDNRARIWGKYHLLLVPNEKVLEKVRGYVIGNPIKHNEIDSISNLANYPYSSFKNIMENSSLELAEELVLSTIKLNPKQLLDGPKDPDK